MWTDAPNSIDLSVVIPIFNEEENVGPLLEEVTAAAGGLGLTYEVICVDDHSSDNSLRTMRELQGRYPALRVLAHSGNFGQSAALVTGFRQARGRVIVTMDGDGQNDPADIPLLMKNLETGVAAVCGVRTRRQDSFVKRVSSVVANRFRDLVTGDRIADAGCTFRAVCRDAMAEILPFNGLHRFLPTILRLQGCVVREVPVNHRPRLRGVTKYGIGNRLWRGLADCFAVRWYRRRSFPVDRLERMNVEKGA